MSIFETVLEWRATSAVGWALLQFLWQGTAIALLVAATLPMLRHRDPRERYALCVSGMGLMLLTFVATFIDAMRTSTAGSGAIELPVLFLGVATRLNHVSWVQSALPWTTLAWGLGALTLQLRMFSQWRYTQRLRTQVEPVCDALQRTVDDLRERVGVRRAVRLAQTTLLSVPAVIGWRNPIVLVPLGIADTITLSQLRAILAHELAHVRRHDQLVNWVQGFFESLLFFHPAVWWLSRRIRVEREFCCDDVAVEACGDALSYARALSTLEDVRAVQLRMSMASTGGSLMMRITRLFSGRTSQPMSRWSWAVFPGLFVALALFAVSCRQTPVQSEQSTTPTSAAETTDMSFGPEGGPLIEIAEDASFTHDPNASPQELLHAGHELIKEELAAGTITHEQAKAHLQKLAQQVHEAMGLTPEDVGALHEASKKLSSAEIHATLQEFSTVLEFKNQDGKGYFVHRGNLDDLSPEDAARLKKTIAEFHAQGLHEEDGKNQWVEDDKLQDHWETDDAARTEPNN